jgi:hypothetical protein
MSHNPDSAWSFSGNRADPAREAEKRWEELGPLWRIQGQRRDNQEAYMTVEKL